MNKKTRTIIYLAVFTSFIAAAVLLYNYLSARYEPQNRLPAKTAQNATATSSPNEDKLLEAPDFVVYDWDGKEVRLSDYKGTPVVLNFWASWCPPCKEEMPNFNKVSEEYSQDELIFLMVDLADGVRETVESGKKYVQDNSFTFTVLFDTERNAASAYSVRSIPSTIFINKDGYVEAGMEGRLDEATLRRGIDMILPD